MCETLQPVEQLIGIENDFQCSTLDDYAYGISLLDMPVEIILKICSFLNPVFLKNTLSHVCQRLQDILSDDTLWKAWIHSRVKGYFPPIPQLKIWEETPINWEEVCVDMDVEYHKWSNVKDTMKHIIVKDMHYASVDTLLLINKGQLCISGSRDRSMALLKLSDVVSTCGDDTNPICKAKPLKMLPMAHSGWVWDLAPDYPDGATNIYSASWDNSVKVWDIETFENKAKFGCGMSVLSLVGNGLEVIAGLYSKKVEIFDQRSGPNSILHYRAHSGAVLNLRQQGDCIASISDDKTMTIYNRVAGKVMKNNIQVPCTDVKAYPECINWSSTALYVGDSRGYIHLFNPEDHTHTGSIEMWEQPPITNPQIKIKCCHQSDGTMIVCSDRGGIKFFYNSYPLTEYASMSSATIDITELRYQNGILAISTCDSAIEFWVPRSTDEKSCL